MKSQTTIFFALSALSALVASPPAEQIADRGTLDTGDDYNECLWVHCGVSLPLSSILFLIKAPSTDTMVRRHATAQVARPAGSPIPATSAT
jgi:hypothetical protein